MTTTHSWRDHFDTYDAFQGALNCLCEQIDKLEPGPRQDPLEHPCRKQFAVMLMQHGEAVCTQAYQSTHDAVIGGRNGERDPIWMPAAYIQNVASRIAGES